MRATRPYMRAITPEMLNTAAPRRAEEGAPPEAEISSLLLTLDFSGELRLQTDAESRLGELIDRHPALALLIRRHTGRVKLEPVCMTLSRPEWNRLHHGLILCAALAWEGTIHVSCADWDTSINATGVRRFPRRLPKKAHPRRIEQPPPLCFAV